VRWLLASCCIAAGCATQVHIPEKVLVPVPVPCLDKLPDAPAVVGDAELLVLDDYGLVLTLARDRATLTAAYGELRAVAQACVK
jgi:hypothetical protein